MMEKVAKAIESTNNDIINELPTGHSSPIANTLSYHEIPNGFLVEFNSPVWSYLNWGTGTRGKFKGKGENGAIIPTEKKALHFKNMEIAAALGFKDENVFLKKVKGIKPRWFLERHYYSRKFTRKISES
jgi:hypothetical protein